MIGRTVSPLCLVLLTLAACSDPTDAGAGSERFTTWGESFIEQGIPAGGGGFVDGWALAYRKFLVNFSNIQVADAGGRVVALLETPRFVDNVRPGIKDLVTFSGLPAKAYPQVSYEIVPAVAGAQVVGEADSEDLAMMIEQGLSVYVAGEATKPDPSDASKALRKTFHWGFKTQTRYRNCHSEGENGVSAAGLVVTGNQTDVSELTTHGDHLYYDRLQSGNDAEPTSLRFEEKAAADERGDQDGEVTLAELCRARIDPSVYNLSGLPGATIGDFVISLVRTVGHFRHEGECTVQRIDPVPAGVLNPCDEYQ